MTASPDDVKSNPDLTVLTPNDPGIRMVGTNVGDPTGLPNLNLSDDELVTPSVTITIEAPQMDPDPVDLEKLPEPTVVDPQES